MHVVVLEIGKLFHPKSLAGAIEGLDPFQPPNLEHNREQLDHNREAGFGFVVLSPVYSNASRVEARNHDAWNSRVSKPRNTSMLVVMHQ
jgi:hypothetical protein